MTRPLRALAAELTARFGNPPDFFDNGPLALAGHRTAVIDFGVGLRHLDSDRK